MKEKKDKMTLTLYPNTKKKLNLYAEEHNTTVSQMIEDWALTLETKGDPQDYVLKTMKKQQLFDFMSNNAIMSLTS